MTDYKNIFGKPVKFLATDPDNAEAEGQIWYNSTSDAFKSIVALEAWSSGAPINFNRAYIAGFGTTTAALGAGGYNPSTFETATEEYNGSGWATGGALNTGRYGLRGAGSQTAGLVFMGIVPGSPGRTGATEEYDGSAWTNGGSLSQVRYNGAAAGTQTAGLAFGGGIAPGPTNFTTNTEEYNGTAWTAGGALNTAIRDNASASAAPQTAAISFGGSNVSSFSAQSEEYDGSSWTVVNSMNLARSVLGGSGIQTSALGYGGAGAPGNSIAKTEVYDGTNWSTSPADLATGRRYLAGAGTNNSAAVAFQGKSGSTNTTLTEEYNKSINVITAAAWSAGGNLNTGRIVGGGAGSQTAAIAFGGNQATPATPANPYMNITEEYNGSSWSPGGNMGTARTSIGAAGTQTATLGFGGINSTTALNSVEEYDGSTWSPGGLMNTATPYSRVGAGTQTAALGYGGAVYSGPGTFAVSNVSEEYNGSAWTSTPNMNTARYIGAGGGTLTAALSAGGYEGPDYSLATEEYNGSAWTTVNSLPQKMNSQGFSGTQTAGLFFGGQFPSVPSSNITNSFYYDGTNYSTAPNLGTGRRALAGGGAGTQTAALAFGGIISPQPAPVGNEASTEEFNGETTALNLKTLTTS